MYHWRQEVLVSLIALLVAFVAGCGGGVDEITNTSPNATKRFDGRILLVEPKTATTGIITVLHPSGMGVPVEYHELFNGCLVASPNHIALCGIDKDTGAWRVFDIDIRK